MEDGGVDRTVINFWQHQLGQMADFLPLLTIFVFAMRHTLMNLVNTTLFEIYVDP